MRFEKNNDIGVFPAISQELFGYGTPVSSVAMIACHALPHSWGCYLLPNDANNKCAVFHLEDSPFADEVCVTEEEQDNSEEYRPLNGNMWLFDGSSTQLRDVIRDQGDEALIDALTYVKLDQDKKFADNLIDLHEQGKF